MYETDSPTVYYCISFSSKKLHFKLNIHTKYLVPSKIFHFSNKICHPKVITVIRFHLLLGPYDDSTCMFFNIFEELWSEGLLRVALQCENSKYSSMTMGSDLFSSGHCDDLTHPFWNIFIELQRQELLHEVLRREKSSSTSSSLFSPELSANLLSTAVYSYRFVTACI